MDMPELEDHLLSLCSVFPSTVFVDISFLLSIFMFVDHDLNNIFLVAIAVPIVHQNRERVTSKVVLALNPSGIFTVTVSSALCST